MKPAEAPVDNGALWQMENGDIVIYALPYLTSGSKVQQQIAQQMQQKNYPW